MGGHIITRACIASLMIALFFMMSSSSSEAQSDSCAQELVPCAGYLNSTKPPSSCCEPLKKTVETQLTCLCNVFYSGLLQTFNISINQAVELSKRCGVTSDLSSCNHAGSAPPPSTGGGPPAAHEGGDKADSSRVSFTGFSILLLLLGPSMLFH